MFSVDILAIYCFHLACMYLSFVRVVVYRRYVGTGQSTHFLSPLLSAAGAPPSWVVCSMVIDACPQGVMCSPGLPTNTSLLAWILPTPTATAVACFKAILGIASCNRVIQRDVLSHDADLAGARASLHRILGESSTIQNRATEQSATLNCCVCSKLCIVLFR